MAGQKIKIDIGTSYNGQGIAGLQRGASRANKSVGTLSRTIGGLKGALNKLGGNLMNIQAGFQMLKSAATGFIGVFKKAFDFESLTTQFSSLLGGIDQAREHMQMLQDLGSTPPFSLEEFAKASRELIVFTNGALGARGSLEMIGDVAAATGKPLDQVSEAVAKFYANLKDGQPIKRSVIALKNMGIITPKVASEIQALEEQGASSTDIWNELTSQFEKYNGAMKKTESTGNGLIGAIGGEWDNAVRTFTGALLETSKGALAPLLEYLRKIQNEGTLDVWARNAASAIEEVKEMARACAGWMGRLLDAYTSLRDGGEKIGAAIGAAVGGVVGGIQSGMVDWDQVFKGAAEAYEQVEQEQRDRVEESIKFEADVKERMIQKQKDKEVQAAQEVANEKNRINEELHQANLERIAQEEKAYDASEKKRHQEANDILGKAFKEHYANADRRQNGRRNKSEAEKHLKAIAQKMDEIKTKIQRIEDLERDQQNGMAYNNQSFGTGFNGGNRYDSYTYHPDANGNLNPGESARSDRMNDGKNRDAAARNMGPNAEARAIDRLGELNTRELNGHRLSDWEKREQERLRNWNDRRNGKGEKERLQQQQQELKNEADKWTNILKQATKDVVFKVKPTSGLK